MGWAFLVQIPPQKPIPRSPARPRSRKRFVELSPAAGCVPQVLASEALTALCASSCGEDGCAFAEQEEVDVLLCALLSPCANVRDTALRVRAHALTGLPCPPPPNIVPQRCCLSCPDGTCRVCAPVCPGGKEQGHRGWLGVILGTGTTKQLYHWFFSLPLKTSPNF